MLHDSSQNNKQAYLSTLWPADDLSQSKQATVSLVCYIPGPPKDRTVLLLLAFVFNKANINSSQRQQNRPRFSVYTSPAGYNYTGASVVCNLTCRGMTQGNSVQQRLTCANMSLQAPSNAGMS